MSFNNGFARKQLCHVCKGVGMLSGVHCQVCKGTGITYNKYNAQKTVYNGVTYASKKEANKAAELDYLKNAGEVLEWRGQPRYVVSPRFIKFGKIYRPIIYIPDFWVKYKDERIEVIDTKGRQTAEFKIKAKLFNLKYPDLKLVIE